MTIRCRGRSRDDRPAERRGPQGVLFTRRRWLRLGTCLAMLAAGCGKTPDAGSATRPTKAAQVAASNSYLEAAVLDLLGQDTPVLRLAEPGMCPGHFDIRPSQINDLRRCRLLLRFDFQAALDDKLAGLTQDGLSICEIHVGGGMCAPPSYGEVCRQIADALVEAHLLDRPSADSRLAQTRARLQQLEAACKQRIVQSGWTDQAVICSHHQAAFCGWLGLRVAATFSGADVTSVGDIEKAVQSGEVTRARVVIANLPEGRRVADALGERLGVKVVVFGNFPLIQGAGPFFDALVEGNVTALLEARQP